MKQSIHLGYEVGSGNAVSIPVRHMVVTGQTQQSGKTTTLEALIHRSNLPAIAFRTKRGEASLHGHSIPPFFRQRADWQFVQSILESTMKERMKFERAWIIRACHGAHTLSDVLENTQKLGVTTKNSLSQDMYMLLGEYLRKVIPLIKALPKVPDKMVFGMVPGLSVMDLSDMPEELQMLIVASTLDWIHKFEKAVITVIPEAWKFIPESKNTPVKVVAEKLAREGAGLKNYLWIDSQDIAGVSKMILRGCSVWLMGVQREANELKRTIDNMPEGTKRPKPGHVSTLELGQFFCCHGSELTKVYVQPQWLADDVARCIATGDTEIAKSVAAPSVTREREEPMSGDPVPRGFSAHKQLTEEELFNAVPMPWNSPMADTVRHIIRSILPVVNGHTVAVQTFASESLQQPANSAPMTQLQVTDELVSVCVMRTIEAIRRDPVLVRLAVEKPVMEVVIKRKTLQLSDSGIKGKIARLIHESINEKPATGFFNHARSFGEIKNEMLRRGVDPKTPNLRIAEPLKEFTQLGFFYRTEGGAYELAPDVDVRAVNA